MPLDLLQRYVNNLLRACCYVRVLDRREVWLYNRAPTIGQGLCFTLLALLLPFDILCICPRTLSCPEFRNVPLHKEQSFPRESQLAQIQTLHN